MPISRRHLGHAAAALASAAALSTAAVPRAQASDEAAVAAVIEGMRKALVAGDGAALKDILADQLVYVHSSGKVEDKAEVIDIVGGKKTVYRNVAFDEVRVTMAGQANAIARAVFSGEAESGGKVNPFKVGTMMVFARQDGKWRLIARQAFRLA
jgi:uncharacterized protein (TIGR02246 family)